MEYMRSYGKTDPNFKAVIQNNYLLRDKLIEEMNGRCSYCGCRLKQGLINIDHIVPVASGGSDDESNLRISCKPCNQRKWKHSEAHFKELMGVKTFYYERRRKKPDIKAELQPAPTFLQVTGEPFSDDQLDYWVAWGYYQLSDGRMVGCYSPNGLQDHPNQVECLYTPF